MRARSLDKVELLKASKRPKVELPYGSGNHTLKREGTAERMVSIKDGGGHHGRSQTRKAQAP